MKNKKAMLTRSAKRTVKHNQSLLGAMVVPVRPCDECPRENAHCKKLILADNSHICVL